MAARTIDIQASTISIRTRAKGMLSRLAHDLEIDASTFDAQIDLADASWTGTLTFAVRDLRVNGALKGDRVERAILSSSDKADIERKIRTDVLTVPEIRVELSGSTQKRGEVTVIGPRGKQTVSVPMQVEERRDGELVVSGDLKLSLSRLGIKEIKGPLGAFRVDDAIEVAFWVMVAAS